MAMPLESGANTAIEVAATTPSDSSSLRVRHRLAPRHNSHHENAVFLLHDDVPSVTPYFEEPGYSAAVLYGVRHAEYIYAPPIQSRWPQLIRQ